jgi:hypothetical protein
MGIVILVMFRRRRQSGGGGASSQRSRCRLMQQQKIPAGLYGGDGRLLAAVGRLNVALQALGRPVHVAAEAAHVLLLKHVHLHVLLVELVQLEGARALLARVVEFRHLGGWAGRRRIRVGWPAAYLLR